MTLFMNESVIQCRFEHKRNKNSSLARVVLLNCQEHFLLAYLEISHVY